jgi:hypothetical protein
MGANVPRKKQREPLDREELILPGRPTFTMSRHDCRRSNDFLVLETPCMYDVDTTD